MENIREIYTLLKIKENVGAYTNNILQYCIVKYNEMKIDVVKMKIKIPFFNRFLRS